MGPWLPEPVVEDEVGGDPADHVTLDDRVSFAILVVLESLTPAERTAWVLHDLFGLPFTDVAASVMARAVGAAFRLLELVTPQGLLSGVGDDLQCPDGSQEQLGWCASQ